MAGSVRYVAPSSVESDDPEKLPQAVQAPLTELEILVSASPRATPTCWWSTARCAAGGPPRTLGLRQDAATASTCRPR